jgi:hypothetical protein
MEVQVCISHPAGVRTAMPRELMTPQGVGLQAAEVSRAEDQAFSVG